LYCSRDVAADRVSGMLVGAACRAAWHLPHITGHRIFTLSTCQGWGSVPDGAGHSERTLECGTPGTECLTRGLLCHTLNARVYQGRTLQAQMDFD
jgi:hypothetical protein